MHLGDHLSGEIIHKCDISLSKTNLFVGVTEETAMLDGIEILVVILLIFSLSNCGGNLHCKEVENHLHLCQPPCKLSPNQCLGP